MVEKGQKVYYTRILPNLNIYDILDLTIRTVTDDWFVGIESRDKQCYLFDMKSLGVEVFTNRDIALQRVLEAELRND